MRIWRKSLLNIKQIKRIIAIPIGFGEHPFSESDIQELGITRHYDGLFQLSTS